MYEIVNGILYNTGIDDAYSDIVNDFQSDTSMGGYEINNGILYNTDIDQTYNELVSVIALFIDILFASAFSFCLSL